MDKVRSFSINALLGFDKRTNLKGDDQPNNEMKNLQERELSETKQVNQDTDNTVSSTYGNRKRARSDEERFCQTKHKNQEDDIKRLSESSELSSNNNTKTNTNISSHDTSTLSCSSNSTRLSDLLEEIPSQKGSNQKVDQAEQAQYFIKERSEAETTGNEKNFTMNSSDEQVFRFLNNTQMPLFSPTSMRNPASGFQFFSQLHSPNPGKMPNSPLGINELMSDLSPFQHSLKSSPYRIFNNMFGFPPGMIPTAPPQSVIHMDSERANHYPVGTLLFNRFVHSISYYFLSSLNKLFINITDLILLPNSSSKN